MENTEDGWTQIQQYYKRSLVVCLQMQTNEIKKCKLKKKTANPDAGNMQIHV